MKKSIQKQKKEREERRKKRVRDQIFGTEERPRFSAFRSNYHTSCQLIDDQKGETIIAVHDRELKSKTKIAKTEIAYKLGKLLAKKAKERRIKEVIFDRDGYKYHGRIKALAEGARAGGLKF